MAARAGGPARSSDEAPVMGVERRGRLIWCCLFEQPGVSREETSEQYGFGRKTVRHTEEPGVAGVEAGPEEQGCRRGGWA